MHNKQYSNLIYFGQLMMLLSLVCFSACLLVTYHWDDHFSINEQIFAHILTIICAGIFKVAVVTVMAAKNEQSTRV